ncbi:MAG: hypothetical protein KJ728_03095 [Alphaproteobacteria bacterium]|uniref:hypothetical protein n=1 Tax=Brevundimonas sp. TaxID=1871086 RepID=UPI001A1910E5|nr:hypothetical protein [Brevundimonas sp.]MBU1271128.1 hypothetical protein [Alphaproteobacteria bacterium]MBJ7318308.1 hypothetical protein [Brevundimonas sp.]MBU1520391.1 hypothetical protein [Alphaproteobacteria bacterium]MBU2029823.1 hypothetical protein [Alphaproteobacteria bacterium]MBU2164649.1 hypothetical protein [Alphaproteobacteria bacterium]
MKKYAMRTAAASFFALAVGAGSASAATMTATFQNMSSETQTVTTSNYNDVYPTGQILAGGTGTGAYTTGTNPNVTANATYQGSSTRGCFFTAQAVYNSSTGRYTFSSNALSRGASGGSVATCTSQITSRNTTTGDFSVTYRVSGF